MIEKIDSVNAFDEWHKRDLFTVRILSLLKSYGCKYQFATFYKQVIDGKITAVLSKLDGDFTLALDSGFDNEELVHFFCVRGYNSILCSDDFLLSPRFEEGVVMSCTAKREPVLLNADVDEYPKLMDLFNFVDYEEQDFKAWYVDISHRVRHGTAKAYTLNVDGYTVSSGILSSIIDDYSILTAVRTDKEFRRMGYASALVSYICCDVKGIVYLMCDSESNERFYAKLGFETKEKWRIYK
ncbi:MAG: GNAT family N-acetyltransferase [Eubacterium sp.]|nr:GNAT family N-acetyltransferase [Eubacterium sp.]